MMKALKGALPAILVLAIPLGIAILVRRAEKRKAAQIVNSHNV